MTAQPQMPEDRLSPEQRENMHSLFGASGPEERAAITTGDGTITFKRSVESLGWPDPIIQDTKDLSDIELANYIEVCGNEYDGIPASARDALVRLLRRK